MSEIDYLFIATHRHDIIRNQELLIDAMCKAIIDLKAEINELRKKQAADIDVL